MAGLVTDEFASTSAALHLDQRLRAGRGTVGHRRSPTTCSTRVYRTVRTADDLLAGSDALASQFDAGTRSGVRALAFALKAEVARRSAAVVSEDSRSTRTASRRQLTSRAPKRSRIVRSLLDSATATIAATPPSAFFNANILTPGMNLTNVIQLFRARYARMANDDATAIAAANLVARTGTGALSVLTFPCPRRQFLRECHRRHERDCAPAAVAAVDGRWRSALHLLRSAFDDSVGRIGALLDPWSRYANPQSPLPVYFPDEALLIKAEALANQNQLAAAQAALDSVRTDCTGGARPRRSEGMSHGADWTAVSDPAPCRDLCAATIRTVRHRPALGRRPSSIGHSWTDRGARRPDRRTALLAAVRAR